MSSLEAYVLFYERIADKPAQIKRIRHSPDGEQVYILAEAWNQLVTMSQPTGVYVPPPLLSFLLMHDPWCLFRPNPYLCPHGASLLSASEMRDRVITIPAAALQDLQSVCPVVPMPTLQKCPKCEEALSALRKRREEEAATVRALDRKWVQKGELWDLISTSWIERWKYFLDERHAGLVQPPGPVSNSDLLLPDNFTPRSGLQKQTHYRGIVKEVWGISYFLFCVLSLGPVLTLFTDVH